MANPEHLKIIKQGANAWNNWRKANPKIQPDLSEVDLRGELLTDFDLSNTLLQGAKLVRAILNKAILKDANLNKANLRWAELGGTNLIRAKLVSAELSETNINNARLDNADLRYANLNKALLQNANMNNANLSGASFISANLQSAKLEKADLTDANFTSANLSGCTLGNAKLDGAKLNGANLGGANLVSSSLDETDLSKAQLSNVKGQGVDFSSAKIDGANFSRAIADEERFGPKQLSDEQRKQLGFSIKITVKETVSEKTDEKQKKYGEGKYGEGVYGENEENETNQNDKASKDHIALQEAFIEFLKKEKHYSEDCFEDIAKKDPQIDLCLVNIETSKPIAIFEFKLTSDDKTLFEATRQLISFCEEGILGKPDPFMYIVCPSHDKSSEPFEIYKIIDNGYESLLSINDFPAYEDLRKKMETKTESSVSEGGDDEDFRNVFRENLIAFLINEKKFPRDSLNHGILAEAPDLDLTVTHPDTDNLLAIFDFKSENYRINSLKPSEFMAKVHKKGFVGKYNPFVYMVYPSKESNEEFVIFEVEDDGTSNEISYEEFPTYKQLLFASPLSDPSRRIYRKLIRLAKDNHGFSVHAPCQDYIDLQIKKNKRAAAQIHRLNDSDKNIALVLAGYQKDFPEAKLTNYMFEGEVKQLSGYTNKYPGEKNWLEGNLGHQRLKYKAGVYILRQGALVLDEIENEVGDLLELAKNNAEGEKEPEAKKVSKYGRGGIATIQMDRLSEVDLLGRDRLVRAFAGMFVHTEEVEGFTVALLGDWGEGKSTVMKLLKKSLNEKHPGRFDFATFNAWEYEHTDNIAAGLSQEVVKGLKCKWNIWKNTILLLCFIFIEHWKGLLVKILYLMIPGTVILSMYYLKVLPQGYSQYFRYGFWGVLFVASIYIFRNAKFVFEHPLLTSMETYLRLPDYGKHLGLIPVLKRHIGILCKLKLNAIRIYKFKWGKDRKLVVFVDDLDRCQTDCIARSLDAIRLVMCIPNVIVMIGIDYRIAFKAMENYYEKLGDKGRDKSEIARDYLGKIIQLPVQLVPSSPEEVRKYIEKRLFPDAQRTEDIKKDADIDTERDIIEPSKPIKEIIETEREDIGDRIRDVQKAGEPKSAEEILKDTTIERDMFSDLAKRFNFTNPRQLLRLRNSYRFLKVMDSDEKYDREILMKNLFWQEFLNNWPSTIRYQCEKSVKEQESLAKIEKPEAKQIVQGVQEDILKIIEMPMYEEIERFVRIVVLPHSEEEG